MSLSALGRSGLTTLLCCTCFVPAFTGCKADQLTSHGTDVALLYDEPEGCENLGVVIGHGGGLSGAYSKPSINRQSAENDARNKAAERGGTHLLLYPEDVSQGDGRGVNPESTDPPLAHGYGTGSNITVAGTAYKCPPGLPIVEPVGMQTGNAFVEVKPPEPTSISLAPLGPLEHITVFRRVPLETGEGMTETEALRIDDPGDPTGRRVPAARSRGSSQVHSHPSRRIRRRARDSVFALRVWLLGVRRESLSSHRWGVRKRIAPQGRTIGVIPSMNRRRCRVVLGTWGTNPMWLVGYQRI